MRMNLNKQEASLILNALNDKIELSRNEILKPRYRKIRQKVLKIYTDIQNGIRE